MPGLYQRKEASPGVVWGFFIDNRLSPLDHFVEKPIPRKLKIKTTSAPNKQIQGELQYFSEDLVSITGSLAFVHTLLNVHCNSHFKNLVKTVWKYFHVLNTIKTKHKSESIATWTCQCSTANESCIKL